MNRFHFNFAFNFNLRPYFTEQEIATGLALAETLDQPRIELIFALAQLQRAIAQKAAGAGSGAGVGEAGDRADRALAALAERVGKVGRCRLTLSYPS